MRASLTLFALSVAPLSGACVTVYQPLATLHRPVVIDTGLANLEGLQLTVKCVPQEHMDRTASDSLCRHVQILFENQGATVHTITRAGGAAAGAEEEEAEAPVPAADLTVELKYRELHREKNPLLWLACIASFTLIPAMSEYTFAQDVTIMDAHGFLLANESMQARFVLYFGGGIWATNQLLDWFAREQHEKIMGKAAKRDFTKDFDSQLSQMVFNAKMRWLVLQEAERAGSGG